MPINDDELLAAVSSGADAATAPVETQTQETNTDEEIDDTATGGADGAADDTGDPADTGDPTDTEGDESADPAAGAEEGEATGEDEPKLGPDGKPVQKAAAEPKVGDLNPATGKPYTAEEIAAKKADDEKAAFRKQQVEDPINAPIPKYLKETTQKRMTKLVEIAKDLTGKFESAQRDRNEIIGMITETGATAAQYTQALQYLKMVNSRDPQQIQAAIGVMQAELAALSRMAGVPVAGVDNLSKHADLKAAVEAKQITQQLAEEIAAGREQRTVQTEQSRIAQQTQQEQTQEHARGVAALNDIGKQLAKTDPNYRVKAQAVLAQIGDQMRQLPPSQWAQTFLVAYTTFKAPAAQRPVAPTARKPVVPKNQPLRGNNPSGGQQAAPKSLEEAIGMGIAAGTRR
jgi:hypothetical protein